MPKTSSGLLLFRVRKGEPEVLLAHPGGPYFRNKDRGAWTIPKGELEADENPLVAAQREFAEETGYEPDGPFYKLSVIKQRGGKVVHGFACQGDFDPGQLRSNTFTIEWPPRSGELAEFPEIDRVDFFGLEAAKEKINAAQAIWLHELPGWIHESD